MAYKRKTRDIWNLYGNYGYGQEILTAADSLKEIRSLKRDYELNDHMVYNLRIKCEREKIEEVNSC
jgi:hypothetical protein